MKTLRGISMILLSLSCANAFAWYFAFPPHVVDSASVEVKGIKRDACVSKDAKLGQTLISPAGNTALVKHLYWLGSNLRCDASTLVPAEVEYDFSFTDRAEFSIPEGYVEFGFKSIDESNRYGGMVLRVHTNTNPDKNLTISILKKFPGLDYFSFASKLQSRLFRKNDLMSNPEKLTIDGLNAVQFEIQGERNKLQALQVYTVIEYPEVIVYLSSTIFSAALIPGDTKAEFSKLAASLSSTK